MLTKALKMEFHKDNIFLYYLLSKYDLSTFHIDRSEAQLELMRVQNRELVNKSID